MCGYTFTICLYRAFCEFTTFPKKHWHQLQYLLQLSQALCFSLPQVDAKGPNAAQIVMAEAAANASKASKASKETTTTTTTTTTAETKEAVALAPVFKTTRPSGPGDAPAQPLFMENLKRLRKNPITDLPTGWKMCIRRGSFLEFLVILYFMFEFFFVKYTLKPCCSTRSNDEQTLFQQADPKVHPPTLTSFRNSAIKSSAP